VPRDYEFTVSPHLISSFAGAGSTITYNFTIQNTGIQSDRYQIEVAAAVWPTSLSTLETGDLNFLEIAQFQVYVTTPSQENLSDTATIRISSLLSGSDPLPPYPIDVLVGTTTVANKIYLPLVKR